MSRRTSRTSPSPSRRATRFPAISRQHVAAMESSDDPSIWCDRRDAPRRAADDRPEDGQSRTRSRSPYWVRSRGLHVSSSPRSRARPSIPSWYRNLADRDAEPRDPVPGPGPQLLGRPADPRRRRLRADLEGPHDDRPYYNDYQSRTEPPDPARASRRAPAGLTRLTDPESTDGHQHGPRSNAPMAIEEIKQLKARYFRCMDTKDWDGVRRRLRDRRLDGHVR